MVLVLTIILFVILARAAWGMYDKARGSERRLAQAEAELKRLEERQSELSGRINYLSTDQGVEAELRTKYRAVKEGESVAVIISDPNQVNGPILSSSRDRLDLSDHFGWWDRILDFLGLI